MATKSNRYLDDQGRIVIPKHIRKALNLGPGNVVSVSLADDGTIRIRADKERCCVCGESVEDKHHTDVDAGSEKKFVCYECAQAIARGMIRGM